MLMVLIMIAGDFLGMSLTTDNVRPSPLPNAWRIGRVTLAGVFMGAGELVLCSLILAVGVYRMRYDLPTLQTLAFVAVVFGNQATMYTNRERRHLWASRPSGWLLASSGVDILLASTLAVCGFAMARVPVLLVAAALLASIAFAFVYDLLKVPIYARLGIG
jgi:H+-transporting ATPase